jgi:hypothetical protein
MMRKMAPWLVVALVCTALGVGLAAGALVAGGGSGGGKTASSSSHPRTVTVVRTTSTAPTTAPASPTAAEQNVAHGLAACVDSLQGHVTLTASAIARLEAICARARSGDQAVRDEARKEACIELVNNLQIPAGPAREHALAICHAP